MRSESFTRDVSSSVKFESLIISEVIALWLGRETQTVVSASRQRGSTPKSIVSLTTCDVGFAGGCVTFALCEQAQIVRIEARSKNRIMINVSGGSGEGGSQDYRSFGT